MGELVLREPESFSQLSVLSLKVRANERRKDENISGLIDPKMIHFPPKYQEEITK